jgi:hypothetical protein
VYNVAEKQIRAFHIYVWNMLRFVRSKWIYSFPRSEVLTVENMLIVVFWVVTPRSLVVK